MPQFLITALGSYGDVHPMVGLGAALAARGHRVKIVTNPYFEDVVTGAGLELVPLGTREEYVRAFAASGFVAPAPRAKAGVVVRVGPHVAAAVRFADCQLRAGRNGVLCACAWTWPAAWPARNWPLRSRASCLRRACCGRCTIRRDSRARCWGRDVPRWLKRLQFWMSDTAVRAAAAWAAAQRLATRARASPVTKRIFQSMVVRDRSDAGIVSRLVRPAAARLAGEYAGGRLSAVGFAGVCPHFPLWENGD